MKRRDKKGRKKKELVIKLPPPGAFANLYTPEEVREMNFLSKASVVKPPHDLE